MLYSRDYTRALFILLQNPIFASQSTFTILAHLLQNLTGLPNSDHQLLVHWFRNLSSSRFKLILRNLLQVSTHAPINLPISVIAYFINTLDSQSSGRGRGGPNYFKVGGLFKKICTSLYANFRKKISSDTSCGRSQTLP